MPGGQHSSNTIERHLKALSELQSALNDEFKKKPLFTPELENVIERYLKAIQNLETEFANNNQLIPKETHQQLNEQKAWRDGFLKDNYRAFKIQELKENYKDEFAKGLVKIKEPLDTNNAKITLIYVNDKYQNFTRTYNIHSFEDRRALTKNVAESTVFQSQATKLGELRRRYAIYDDRLRGDPNDPRKIIFKMNGVSNEFNIDVTHSLKELRKLLSAVHAQNNPKQEQKAKLTEFNKEYGISDGRLRGAVDSHYLVFRNQENIFKRYRIDNAAEMKALRGELAQAYPKNKPASPATTIPQLIKDEVLIDKINQALEGQPNGRYPRSHPLFTSYHLEYSLFKWGDQIYVIDEGRKHGKLLGEGGFGAVKRVQNLNNPTDEQVLKIQIVRDVQGAVRATERELRMLHTVYNITAPTKVVARKNKDQQDQIEFLMPRAKGMELSIYLQQSKPENLTKIALAVMEGYEKIQSKNILHRDIKAQNIYYDPSSGKATFIDFGLAFEKDAHGELLDWGLQGTPGYVGPELRDSVMNRYSEKTEVFALGVTLANILCSEGLRKATQNATTAPTYSPLPLSKPANPIEDMKINLVNRMMHSEPAQRPSFAACKEELATINHLESIVKSVFEMKKNYSDLVGRFIPGTHRQDMKSLIGFVNEVLKKPTTANEKIDNIKQELAARFTEMARVFQEKHPGQNYHDYINNNSNGHHYARHLALVLQAFSTKTEQEALGIDKIKIPLRYEEKNMINITKDYRKAIAAEIKKDDVNIEDNTLPTPK